jgi:hypothetical protein
MLYRSTSLTIVMLVKSWLRGSPIDVAAYVPPSGARGPSPSLAR